MSHDDRMTDLESTIAFQEQIIEQLNQVVTEHEQRIDRLEAQLTRLVETLERGATLRAIEDEEPPPHY